MSRGLLFAIVSFVVLALLQIIGFLFPSSLNWGVHFLGFLSPMYFVAYLLLLVIGFIVTIRGSIEKVVDLIAEFMERSPRKFLASVVILFVGAAYLLKMYAPWWGDGAFIMKNFSEALNGTSPLYLRNEPLATEYYYGVFRLFNARTYKEFLQAYWVADVLVGIGFIMTAYYLASNLANNKKIKLLIFAFLCSGAYMQLFFGYVETYSIVVFLVAVYVLLSLLFLNGKCSFPLLSFAFFFQGVTHYLTGMLVFSFLYLMYKEWKKKGIKNIVIGLAIIAVGVFVTLALANFNLDNLSSWEPHKHYISLTTTTELAEVYSQAYTMFSPFHVMDILNAYVMVGGAAIALLIFSLLKQRTTFWNTEQATFFILALLPFLAFTMTAKFDLGAAKDWDVTAPYYQLVVLFACYLFVREHTSDSTKILALLILITLLNSLSWFALNTTRNPAIQRTKTLLDKRTVSELGQYAASLHLSIFFHQVNDHGPTIPLWKDYNAKFPYDRRGYVNIIQNMKFVNTEDYFGVRNVYEAWMMVDSLNGDLHTEYSQFCLDAGNYYFGKEMLDTAKQFYVRARELNPVSARAYNNIGSVLAFQDSEAVAIEYFRKAIALDSLYSDPYYNLGLACGDLGRKDEGKLYIQRAAALGNVAAQKELQHNQ